VVGYSSRHHIARFSAVKTPRSQNADIAGSNSVHINIQAPLHQASQPAKLDPNQIHPQVRQTLKDAMLAAISTVGTEYNAGVRGAKGPEIDTKTKDYALAFILTFPSDAAYHAFIDDKLGRSRRIETIFDNTIAASLGRLNPAIGTFESMTQAEATLTYLVKTPERDDRWTTTITLLGLLFVILCVVWLLNSANTRI
jgi:hypothetical protein